MRWSVGVFTRIHQIDRRVRVAFYGRVLAWAVLVLLHFAWGRQQPEYAMYTGWGLVLFTLVTLVIAALVFRGPAVDISRLVAVSAVADSIALGVLTAGLGEMEDPFYAWYIAEAAVFGLVARRRQAWLFSGLLAISYLVSHSIAHWPFDAIMYLFLTSKVAALMLVGGLVTVVVGSQEERRTQLETHQDEVLELYAKLERSVAELRAVTQITEIIHSTLDIDAVGPTLLDILHKVLEIPASCIYVIDKNKQEMVFSASRGVSGATMSDMSALEIGGAVSPAADAERAFACTDLIDSDTTLVVFCAEGPVIEGLSSDDRIVLQTVASELVVAVENSRLYRLTKRLAITDELTDLYNYRYLQQRLDEEIGRADRYGKQLSFLMLDIDNFKRVNDVHGHRVGDGVLAGIGQILKSTVREVDVVARYGGEEFSVLLPETDASGAFIVAEKIREAISLARLKDADGQARIHVTVSIGLASYPVHAHDKEALLKAADDAVYHAKETGKNRVRAPRLRLRSMPADAPAREEVAE